MFEVEEPVDISAESLFSDSHLRQAHNLPRYSFVGLALYGLDPELRAF